MKKAKALLPKTTTWRKILKITIWTGVVFWTLGSIRGFSLAAKVNEIPQQQNVAQIVQHENFATSEGARTFAQNFLKEYLTWDINNYQDRVDRLKPYIRSGLDEQAGVRFDKLTGNSSLKKIESWEISETGKDTSLITFRTTQTITTSVQSTDAAGVVTNQEQTTEPFEKWIQVPIITDGKGFLVNGIPTYTSKPAAANIKPVETSQEAANIEPKIKDEIKEFLNTFYKQYSTGTIEELEYLTLDKDIRPLDSTIVFNELQNLVVLKEKDKEYTIESEALFTDNNSKAQLVQKYKMTVSKENGRWQVIKFN